MRQLSWRLSLATFAAMILAGAGRAEIPPALPPDAKPAAATSSKDLGPLEVETALYDWTDAARSRQVPVKVYYPKTGQGPYPVIIFSHGLGGSRDGYEYLGRYWAGYGYVSVHVQHIGSDTAAWQGDFRPLKSMSAAAADPSNAVNRPLDIRFAIDQLAKVNKEEGPLKGRLDMDRLGAAGHSFGAYTTLAVAGEVFVTAQGREILAARPARQGRHRHEQPGAEGPHDPRQGVRVDSHSGLPHDRHQGRQPHRRHQGRRPPPAV